MIIVRAALACVMVLGAVAEAIAAEKPRVPPGRDPGGVAVALVGPGLDYTDARIAARLARDGEGEIVGFDLIDGDRRPYATSIDVQARAVAAVDAARLVVFRVNGAEVASLARGIAMAAMSPARIVVLDATAGATLKREGIVAVAQRLGDRLVVVPLGADAGWAARGEAWPGNVVVVTGCRRGAAGCALPFAETAADVGVVLDAGARGGVGEVSGEAAGVIAGLAVGVLAGDVGLDGAGVVARIKAAGVPADATVWMNERLQPAK